MPFHRNPIGLITLGLFAGISLFGEGLHLFSSAEQCSHQVHTCAHDHHHPHHGATPATDSDAKVDHDCPICRFLAQAQLRTAVRLELIWTDSCAMLNDRQPLVIALRLVALHLARAPPLASYCCNG